MFALLEWECLPQDVLLAPSSLEDGRAMGCHSPKLGLLLV